MIPGMSKMTKNLDIDDKAFNKVESIIQSMTPDERANPELVLKTNSRKKRIARGCGQDLQQINMFLKQFDQMRQMMHKMSKGQGLPGMDGLPGAGRGGRRRRR
jgi:signal recognition particle subunit SRP54